MDKSSGIEVCINECVECLKAYTLAINYLKKGKARSPDSHIPLLVDTSRICEISMEFLLRRSQFSIDICIVCSEICDACANYCKKFEEKVMKKCASACTRCSKSCIEMGRINDY